MRTVTHRSAALIAMLALAGATGCAAEETYVPRSPTDPTSWRDGEAPAQVGDPCSIDPPPEGFANLEVHAELRSDACGGLVCMAYHVDSNPGEPIASSQDQLFCTCRCSLLEGDPTTPLCRCAPGTHCVDEVFSFSGTDLAGGYCVPCIRPDDDRHLDPTVFSECDDP